MQKKIIALGASLFFLISAFAASTDLPEPAENPCRDTPVIEKSKQQAGFKITLGHAGDFLCHFVEVKKQNRVVYRDEEIGSHYYFGANPDREETPFMRLGKGGHLTLTISKWSGGAHCCFTLKIFDLDDGFRSLADVAGGSFIPLLKDIDGDGIPEIEVEDDFLAYRFASFATSATGHIILKYRNGRYEVATELMRKAPSFLLTANNKKVEFWQKELSHAAESEFPQPFLQAITDLIYSGNKNSALNLIDRVWPKDRQGKDSFVKAYEEALRDSRFYPELEKRIL